MLILHSLFSVSALLCFHRYLHLPLPYLTMRDGHLACWIGFMLALLMALLSTFVSGARDGCLIYVTTLFFTI